MGVNPAADRNRGELDSNPEILSLKGIWAETTTTTMTMTATQQQEGRERERESGDAEVLRHPRGTAAKKLMKESFLVALDSDICFPKSEDFRGIPKKAARLDQGPLF